MKRFLNFISKILHRTKVMSAEEFYYSQSVDHVDLERRMRQVQRRQAPFQARI